MPDYVAHGLKIHSELSCPELMPVAGFASADVSMVYGKTPASLEAPIGSGAIYQALPNEFLLAAPGVARFWVQDGACVTIEPFAGSDEHTIRLWLIGAALGALLVQRGQVILHGSAVETERGAVIFVGDSGAGKSTTAAAFRQRGHRALSDDVSLITTDDAVGCTVMYPGLAHIQLWADARDRLALQETALRRVRPELERYALSLADSYDPRPVPLHAVYVLNTAGQGESQVEFSIDELGYLEKFGVLERYIYQKRAMNAMGRRAEIFQKLTRLTRRIRVCRVTRPEKGFRIEELVERIAADWMTT